MSQPGSKSTSRDASPSVERVEVSSTPSTACSAGPSTWTTAASTSSAPAPDQATVTPMLSTTTSGKNCARIRGTDAIPAAISTTKRRLDAVRWRAK